MKMCGKVISFLMIIAMVISVFSGTTAFAAGITASATVDKSEITSSDQEQKVVVTLTLSEPLQSVGYSAYLCVPEGWYIAKSSDVKLMIANPIPDGPTTETAGFANNRIARALTDKAYGENEDEFIKINGFKITYTVPANAAAGTFVLGMDSLKMSYFNGTNAITADVHVSVTVSEPAPAGYALTIAAPSSATVNDRINVTLDVTSGDETAYNAFYAVLSYDKTKVSYVGENTVNGFAVNSAVEGALKITKSGADVTIADGADITLPFTAEAAGSAAFDVSGAKIDKAANAEGDAVAPTVYGNPATVAISEPVITYSVSLTLGANMTAAGGSLTQNDLIGAMEAVIVTPADGYTLNAPTITGSGVTATANDNGSYTISGTPTSNVTVVFADAAEIAPVVTALTSAYCDGYVLVTATVDKAGYVPTYDGEAMFRISGDDSNFYYVVKSYDANKLGFVEGVAAVITRSADANGTGTTDINDAQFVYNVYNGYYANSAAMTVEKLLRADVDGSGVVDVTDCAAVVAAI